MDKAYLINWNLEFCMHEFIWKKSSYKCFISKWGIAVVLEAGYKILSDIEAKDKYIKISENIYFYSSLIPYPISNVLTTEELKYFCKGLKLVNKQILEILQGNSCLVVLRSMEFSDCYIQNDGFTACAIQWASETFGFPMPIINVRFDSLKTPYGKYIFDFSYI